MGGIRQRLQLRYSGGTPGDASEPLTNFLDVSTMLEEPLLKLLIQKNRSICHYRTAHHIWLSRKISCALILTLIYH